MASTCSDIHRRLHPKSSVNPCSELFSSGYRAKRQSINAIDAVSTYKYCSEPTRDALLATVWARAIEGARAWLSECPGA